MVLCLMNKIFIANILNCSPEDINALEGELRTGRFKTAKDIHHWRSSKRRKPMVSLQMSYLFLEQLVATEAEAIHVVIWDKAGFHLDDEHHQLPEQIRLLPLPAHCPELNPMAISHALASL